LQFACLYLICHSLSVSTDTSLMAHPVARRKVRSTLFFVGINSDSSYVYGMYHKTFMKERQRNERFEELRVDVKDNTLVDLENLLLKY
jgi:predicted alpha/beta hydrolase family esterase